MIKCVRLIKCADANKSRSVETETETTLQMKDDNYCDQDIGLLDHEISIPRAGFSNPSSSSTITKSTSHLLAMQLKTRESAIILHFYFFIKVNVTSALRVRS